jgi:phospholipid-translocating ATPase
MLTGDKIETAKCIAIATGLKAKKEAIFEMIDRDTKKDLTKPEEISECLDRFVKYIDTSMLMISGTTLDHVLANPNLTFKFFSTAVQGKSVCVCRCSPMQKAACAKEIVRVTGKRIACIGDGGNDVPMIMEADVGLGIVGKEGKQASLAADFSINKFKDCK